MKKTLPLALPSNFHNIFSRRTEVEDGYYINTFYPFAPGFFLFLNEVHATNIAIGTFPRETEMLILNYCISGRCEFKTNAEEYRYLTDNNLSVGGYVVRESFFYPTDYYLGFEVGIVEALFTDETYALLREFSIDLDRLRGLSREHDGLLILESNGELQKLWLDMYGNNGDDAYLIKLDFLKILRILCKREFGAGKDKVYLTKGQMSLAKEVHRRLTRDISVHVSMREIAEDLKVSESSLKKYFKIMFDRDVSEYMRSVRLKKAAKLLAETKLSIFDIAALCGYTNQGRFAKIFHEYYGMRPLEYRHEFCRLGVLPQGSLPQGSLPQGSLPQGSDPSGKKDCAQPNLPPGSDPRGKFATGV